MLAAYISFPRLVYTVHTCYMWGMPKIILNVSDDVKELWVAAAHDERVSLSEWIRRAGEFRAGLPEREGVPGVALPELPESSYPRGASPLPTSVKEFRGHDPKKKP